MRDHLVTPLGTPSVAGVWCSQPSAPSTLPCNSRVVKVTK